jgi:uncharacterized protein (DUF1697 family)
VIRFAALLRGVNVGKDRRLPMARLRALFTQMGYADAATLVNSGNVVFSAAKGAPALHAAAIAAAGVLPPRVGGSKLAADQLPASIR